MVVTVFPTLPGLSYPVKRTPTWKTVNQESLSGQRTRLSFRTIPQWQWELTFDLLRSQNSFTEWQTIVAFYNSVQGSAGIFAYDDVDDDSVTTQAFGVGDGTTTIFQLVRSLGGYVEPVLMTNPSPTPQIFANAVLQTTPGQYSLTGNGAVTFVAAPAGGVVLTWTGKYYWLARFDDDTIDTSKFMNGLWELKKITFTSELL